MNRTGQDRTRLDRSGDDVVHVRVTGSPRRCLAVLDLLRQIAVLTEPDGPHPRRRGTAVSFYTDAVLIYPDPPPDA